MLFNGINLGCTSELPGTLVDFIPISYN